MKNRKHGLCIFTGTGKIARESAFVLVCGFVWLSLASPAVMSAPKEAVPPTNCVFISAKGATSLWSDEPALDLSECKTFMLKNIAWLHIELSFDEKESALHRLIEYVESGSVVYFSKKAVDEPKNNSDRKINVEKNRHKITNTCNLHFQRNADGGIQPLPPQLLPQILPLPKDQVASKLAELLVSQIQFACEELRP